MAQYPIGFWSHTTLDMEYVRTHPKEVVKDWADAGMTMADLPYYTEFPGSREIMNTILDEAHKYGIQCLFEDRRLNETGFPQVYDEEKIRAWAAKFREEFAHHPAVEYIYIEDEPSTSSMDLDILVKTIRLVKELVPECKPFLNFHPWQGGWASSALDQPGKPYQEVLADFAEKASLDLLSYDCYAQLWYQGNGWTHYFHNLNLFREASKKAGIPFFNTFLTAGHWVYRQPNEGDMRWQLNTSVAHGANGVMGYFFHTIHAMRYEVGLVDRHYKRSSQFELQARVNDMFNELYGQLIPELTLEKVWHVNQTYGGTPLFHEGADPNIVHLETEDEMIVSRFRHKDGSLYYALVNNSNTKNASFQLHFRDGLKVWTICNGFETSGAETRKSEMYGVPTIAAGSWLNCIVIGGMYMWKIEE